MTPLIPDKMPGLVAALVTSGPALGKAAFIGVFVLLLIWLLVLPARLIGTDQGPMPWWRNSRIWAVAVAIGQILIYIRWG